MLGHFLQRSITALNSRAFVSTPRLNLKIDQEHYTKERDFWNKSAEWYVKYASRSSAKIYQSFLPFLDLHNARRVLEAGGGPGNEIEILLPNSGPDTEYVCGDLSDVSYIQIFVELAKKKNLPRTECVLSMQNLCHLRMSILIDT